MESQKVSKVAFCKYCNGEFIQSRSDKKWCSKKCSKAANYQRNREKILERCKKYQSENPEGKKARQEKYLSSPKGKETTKKRRERYKEKAKENWKRWYERNRPPQLEKICPVCLGIFKTLRKNQICCSGACAKQKWASENRGKSNSIKKKWEEKHCRDADYRKKRAAWCKEWRIKNPDKYIRGYIKKMGYVDLPDELIELKVKQISLKREITKNRK